MFYLTSLLIAKVKSVDVNHWWTDSDKENRGTSSATVYATNPTCCGLESNPGLHIESSATNHL